MTAGSSGEPKFRQSVTATGTAPEDATLRIDSARASWAPARGSSWQKRALASIDTATPRPLASSTRTTPASAGVADVVLPRT